jgi:hypothetical protein
MTDVLKDSGAEQDWFLTNETHTRSQVFDVEGSDFVAVKENIAFHRVIKTFKKLQESRLSRPRRTHDGSKFPLWNIHVYILQDGNCISNS